MKIKRTYICGPVSGYDYHERFERFEKEEEEIFRHGEIPVNPMKNGLGKDADWHMHMAIDRNLIMTCQKMIVLPYYEDSRGCNEEIELASNLGLDITYRSRINEKRPSADGRISSAGFP